MEITPAGPDQLETILTIEREAFGEPDEAELVRALLADPSAAPLINLVATLDGMPVGHILLTRVTLRDETTPLECRILAPLAVVPQAQGKGVGQALMAEALRRAREEGVDLVFVLGHPGYYPKAGFRGGAGPLGFPAPYPIPPEHTDAWMVQELRPGVIGRVKGQVVPARSLDRPEYWRE